MINSTQISIILIWKISLEFLGFLRIQRARFIYLLNRCKKAEEDIGLYTKDTERYLTIYLPKQYSSQVKENKKSINLTSYAVKLIVLYRNKSNAY